MHEALRTTLAEIEQVLEAERVALRALDVPGIELAANRKRDLEARLRACAEAGQIKPEDRTAVAQIREAALANQLLLVHARSCVKGALALATGHSQDPYSNASTASPGPLRLNLKG